MSLVVIYDPTGKLPIGEIVEGEKSGVARRRGVVMLPADDRMHYSGMPGFFYRPWGNGVVYDNMQPQRDCSMMLAVSPHVEHVYWSVMLRQIREGEQMTGRIRMVGNPAAGAMSTGMTQTVVMPQLESLSFQDGAGLVFTGYNTCSVVNDGMFGLSLYGVCRNVKVMWSVATVAADRIEIPPIVSVPKPQEQRAATVVHNATA